MILEEFGTNCRKYFAVMAENKHSFYVSDGDTRAEFKSEVKALKLYQKLCEKAILKSNNNKTE